MFPELETAVDTVEIPLEREAIVGAIGLRDRWDAKISTAVGEYQALGLHEVDGSVTMGSWLRHWAKLDSTSAIRSVRRAAKLQRLPVLREAFCAGVLSGARSTSSCTWCSTSTSGSSPNTKPSSSRGSQSWTSMG